MMPQDALDQAKQSLFAAAILADGYGKPETASRFRDALKALRDYEDRWEFAGWTCKHGGGDHFHSDPLEGCPGPHIPVWIFKK